MDPMDINIFDSDSDLEDEMLGNIGRQPKVYKNRPDYFEELDDLEFFKRFRLQKESCRMVLNRIQDEIKSPTDRNHAISPATKLFLTLRFYATGNMLIAVADFVGVSKSAACSIVSLVTVAIASLRAEYVKFSETQAEREAVKEEFYRIARFPHVIGAIDCTHVRIQSPGGNEAERYRNRKGYFSWNVQTICDARLRIIDIVARWPGSARDQTIFNNSRIKGRFQRNEFGHQSILLGDRGYGNSKYLVTPLKQPNTRAENLYNESHIRTRNCVEWSHGVWKRRFPVLSVGMHASLEHSMAIMVATAVLHNLAIQEREDEPPIEVQVDGVNIPGDRNVAVVENVNNYVRMELINNHFANL